MKLIIPTLFDIAGTIFLNYGLIFIKSPLYIILKGFGLVSVVILSRTLLKKKYDLYKYIAIAIILLGVLSSGIFSYFVINNKPLESPQTFIGIASVLCGYIIYGFQYVITEKLLKDCNPHPLEMVGIEGLAGCTFFIIILPISYIINRRISVYGIENLKCTSSISDTFGDCFNDIFTSEKLNNKKFIDMPQILRYLFNSPINYLVPIASWLLIAFLAVYNYLLVDLISHSSATAFALLDPMKMFVVSLVYIVLFIAIPRYDPAPDRALLYIVGCGCSVIIITIGYLIFYEKIRLKCLSNEYSVPVYSNPSSTDSSLNLRSSILSGEELISEEDMHKAK
jgi:hypothetical protein